MALGGVMTTAMMLNLLMAALMGVIIPMTMVKLGRDPAIGSSVMITAITDTGGFFIFLGLATLFWCSRAFASDDAWQDQHRQYPGNHANSGLPVDTVAATVISITSVSLTGIFASVAG